jgi:(3S)-malyl-CoA thioesterase
LARRSGRFAGLAAQLDGLVLPKAEDPAAFSALAAQTGGLPLWALIETPRGVLRAEALADHPAVAGLIMGSNDLAAALHLPPGPAQRQGLLPSLSLAVLAARAAGKPVLDGVFNALGPAHETALAAECAAGRTLGFDGKTLIHPGQIGPAHAAFSPSSAELAKAEALAAAWAKAEAAGEGVALLDGVMIEALHARAAKALLHKAALINARNRNEGIKE